MTLNNNMKKVAVIVVLLPILMIFIALTISSNDNGKGITAMDAAILANIPAQKWDSNATLLQVRSGDIFDDGTSDYWYVVYAKSTFIGNLTDIVEYKVYSNETCIIIPRSESQYWGDGLELYWNVDSDRAYDIANEYSEVKVWLSKHNRAEVSHIGIGINSIYSEPIWNIEWVDPGFLDDPHDARIIIDANTGEVISFDDDI